VSGLRADTPFPVNDLVDSAWGHITREVHVVVNAAGDSWGLDRNRAVSHRFPARWVSEGGKEFIDSMIAVQWMSQWHRRV